MRVETKTNPNRTIALIVLLIVFLSVTIFTITERHTVIAFKPTSNLTGESTSTPQPHQQISPGSMTCDSQLCFVRAWGYEGTGNGQFNGTLGIAIDPSGDTYVTDTDNNLVQKFTSNGTFITKWGSAGSGEGQFKGPNAIAVGSSGDVYVTDTGSNRIQVFKQVITESNNHSPNAIDKSFTTSVNTPVSITLLASDKDNDNLTASVQSSPLHVYLQV